MEDNSKQSQNLDDIILFGGNLRELEQFTGQKFEIVNPYFVSRSHPHNYAFEKLCKHEVKSRGYDGLIHLQEHSNRCILNIIYDSRYLTGLPVQRKTE